VTAFLITKSVGNAEVADSVHVGRHALGDESCEELLEDYSRDEGHR
jgi:hypothetical protein